MTANQIKRGDRRIWGAVLLIIGLIMATVAVDVIKVDEAVLQAPRWILFLISVVFGSAGGLLIVGQHSRGSELLAAAVLFSMAAIGAWVSLFSSSEGFSGGLAILPREVNVVMARVLFGLGAILTLAMGAYAVKRAIRHDA